jgi:DNA-binding transcriptional MerR regulator
MLSQIYRKTNLNLKLTLFSYINGHGRNGMTTSEIIGKLDIPRHKLYYLEQKGYVKPKRIPMGDLEAREFSKQDFERIKLIWKYLQRGFKHKVAYQMAAKELKTGKVAI